MYLIKEIQEKPLLGHSPNKDELREKNIYPESEYIFIAYKYGLIGLTVFLFFYFYPIYSFFNNNINEYKQGSFLFFIVCYIASITNIPFEDFQLNVFLSLNLARYYF
ncbi:MAG: hypothetical protein OHK0036_08130 [Bacteroidia bacterium]